MAIFREKTASGQEAQITEGKLKSPCPRASPMPALNDTCPLHRFTLLTTMRRVGASPFSFPEFGGATRRLVLVNLGAFFALLLAQSAFPHPAVPFKELFGFIPGAFLHGSVWQPLTYSFVHPGIFGTLFELLSLWFLAGFLESLHASSWVMGLYAASVLGTATAATAIYAASGTLGYSLTEVPLYGCAGGIFGLLVAIGALYGDMEFLLFFTIGIKARYLVALYALVSIAMLFGELRMYAFAQLGGALAGLLSCSLRRAEESILPSARGGIGCATTTTAGSAAAPPASSRSICAPRGAPSTWTVTASRSTTTRTTKNAGTEAGWHGAFCAWGGRIQFSLECPQKSPFSFRGRVRRLLAWAANSPSAFPSPPRPLPKPMMPLAFRSRSSSSRDRQMSFASPRILSRPFSPSAWQHGAYSRRMALSRPWQPATRLESGAPTWPPEPSALPMPCAP